MVFIDETGKRWRRVKRTTKLLVGGISVFVAVLVSAAMFYKPQWSNFTFVKSDSTSSGHSSGLPFFPTKTTVTSTTEHKTTPKNTKLTSEPTQQPALRAVSQTQTNTSQPTTTTTVPTTPTSTKTTDPGNSAFGQSHKPTRS